MATSPDTGAFTPGRVQAGGAGPGWESLGEDGTGADQPVTRDTREQTLARSTRVSRGGLFPFLLHLKV